MTTVNRSARTGQFVSNATAARWPQYTTTERIGAGTSNNQTVFRDAGSGQFVSAAFAARNPAKTIRQMV
ncbi:ABC transporter ATP-binding protein [Microbacterium hydrocarbonoxydans]|uniref:ABC transporter ATP-binding protein n=1 Tax=Microbacterium hydrocarbonoxydans TaxID=273678 RepID=UPI003D9721EF